MKRGSPPSRTALAASPAATIPRKGPPRQRWQVSLLSVAALLLMAPLHAKPQQQTPAGPPQQVMPQPQSATPWLLWALIGSGALAAVGVSRWQHWEKRQTDLERDLQEQTDLFQAAFDQSLDAVLLITPTGEILKANQASAALYGVAEPGQFSDLTPNDFSPSHQPDGTPTQERVQQVIEEAMREGQSQFEWMHQRINSGEQWLGQVSLKAITINHRPVLLARARDVSQERRHEQFLETLAYKDPLTGLPNRLASLDWLKKQFTANPGIALALIHLDLDQFQAVNERCGSEAGDSILRLVAEQLRAQLGPQDWAARLESDAYLVIVRGYSTDEAIQWVHSVQTAIASACANNSAIPVRVTFSAGISTCTAGSQQNPNERLEQANSALSIARARGDNQVQVYNASISSGVERRLFLERELERAIHAGCGEFSLYYQPQMNGQRQLNGAEALLRWTLSDGTPVAPMEFIPVAERSGHIQRLSSWIIAESCRQLASWQQLPKPLPRLAINISTRQFDPINQRVTLLEELLHQIQSHGLNPSMLELEITETALMQSKPLALGQMHQLARQGFPLAIDDFGTGFASLELLKEVPAGTLKIDKEFVDGIETTPEDQAIIEASLLIAKRLDLHTVAEGVETESQFQALKALGCESFQGYLFSAPLTAQAFADRYLA